jgi:hypothetical protein
LAEQFLASRVLDYCRHVLAHLRNVLEFTIGGLLLMLIAVSSYPFPYQDRLLYFGWAAILTAVVITIFVLVQMNKDRTLSLLSGGNPNQIDLNRASCFTCSSTRQSLC